MSEPTGDPLDPDNPQSEIEQYGEQFGYDYTDAKNGGPPPNNPQATRDTGGHHENADVLTVRELQAIEMRKAGLSYHQIAQALGYANKGGAYKAVHRALRKWGQPVTDEYRVLELARYDAITARLWNKALGRPGRSGGVNDDGTVVEPREEIEPDYNALQFVMRAMEGRRRLLGLDAQQILEPEGDGPAEIGMVEDFEQFQSAVDELAALTIEHGGHVVIQGEVDRTAT